MTSKYILGFLANSKRYAHGESSQSHHDDVQKFAKEFKRGLKKEFEKKNNKGQTNKSQIPTIVRDALEKMFSSYIKDGQVTWCPEPNIYEVLGVAHTANLGGQQLVAKKKADLAISGPKAILIIEF